MKFPNPMTPTWEKSRSKHHPAPRSQVRTARAPASTETKMAKPVENISQIKSVGGTARFNKDSLGVEDFKFRGKGAGDDFLSGLDKMAEAMRHQQQENQAAIKLDALDLGSGLASEALAAQESKVDKLLKQAKQLIIEKKYEEAINPLAELLSIQAAHHEAIYLLALCHASLNQFEPALETLLPLRSARLDNALASRIAALKAEIRNKMFLVVVLENSVLLQSGQHDAAISRLRRVVHLDPEFAIYHYMLSGVLMQANKLKEAVAAVNHGLDNCANQREILTELKLQIENKYVASKMKQARSLFKAGHYRRARSALNYVEPDYRKVPLYVTFANYLARLDGGILGLFVKKSIQDVRPSGIARDVESLYDFLIEEELEQATRLISKENYEQAETVLDGAIKYTHNYPYASYLYGGCIYSHAMQQVTSKNPPALADVVEQLERARDFARIGRTDESISDAADLLASIEMVHKHLCSVRDKLSVRQAEVRAINSAIEEFDSIMKSGQKGVTSPEHHRSIYERMKNLNKRIPELRKQMKSSDVKEAVAQLAQAIDQNLRQLEELGEQVKDSQSVKECHEKFSRMINIIKSNGGIKDRKQLNQTLDYFRSLRSESKTVKSKVRSSEAKCSMSELIKALDQVITQLGG
jgi:Flp pilus assembly protein TadD